MIGDYKLNFGQGLVVGSALMSGKGGGVGSVSSVFVLIIACMATVADL